MYLASIALVTMSLVLYQLAQRWVSAGTNAWSPLVVALVSSRCSSSAMVSMRTLVGSGCAAAGREAWGELPDACCPLLMQ
jgi:hypothetical protein